jgi:hypothetical protein
VIEFDVHYDCCAPVRMRELRAAAGFRQVEIGVCWSQSGYILPVFPARLPAAYQWLVRALRLESLAACMIARAAR